MTAARRISALARGWLRGVNARETLTAHQALARSHVVLHEQNQRLRPECSRRQAVPGTQCPWLVRASFRAKIREYTLP